MPPFMKPKAAGLLVLVLLIVVSIALYVVLMSMQCNYQWQHVRLLTWDERVRVAAKYGEYGATYKYVVTKPVRKEFCGHAVTVPVDFMSDGVSAPVWGVDPYDESEWLCHDWLYEHQRADDGTYIVKSAADSVFSLPDRRIAVALWGQSTWYESGRVGPIFLGDV
jgi:hypothetical protein